MNVVIDTPPAADPLDLDAPPPAGLDAYLALEPVRDHLAYDRGECDPAEERARWDAAGPATRERVRAELQFRQDARRYGHYTIERLTVQLAERLPDLLRWADGWPSDSPVRAHLLALHAAVGAATDGIFGVYITVGQGQPVDWTPAPADAEGGAG